MNTKLERLEELTLELTDWCPLRCLHCSTNSSPDRNNYLDKELSFRLVEEAASLGATKISFGGGEPTAAKIFIDVLTRTIDLGMSGEVFTCGLRGISQGVHSFSSEILNRCKEFSGVKFIFSFHGATAAIHDYVTQVPGSFKILTDALDKCLSFGIKCETNFVPMSTNIHQFKDIVDLISNLGMKKISVLRFVPQGRGHENEKELELSREKEDSFLKTLQQLRKNIKIKIRTGSPFNGIIPNNRVPCRAGAKKLVVQANGNVLPCEVFKDIGRCDWGLSVYNQSLNEILRDSQLIELYDTLKQHNCLECPVHSVLRAKQKQETSHGLSETAIQAQ